MTRPVRFATLVGTVILGVWLLMGAATNSIKSPDLPEFVNEMVKKHGFDRAALTATLAEAQFHQRIIEVISRPAESKPWYEYRPIFLNRSRIEGGAKFWDAHAQTLDRAEEVYGVPPEVITAILGVETRYGAHSGSFRVLDALATLAFGYPPRSAFFRSELEQYLLLTREERLDPVTATGSYAGAMGQAQFMPSSFRRYAVDFDGDGRRDIWNNTADAIGSIANYLAVHGWERGQAVTARVEINGDGYKDILSKGTKPSVPVAELNRRGISLNAKLPPTALASIIELQADADKSLEHWVGLQNFYTITRYNHSELYAMAVYQLAEEIKAQRRR